MMPKRSLENALWRALFKEIRRNLVLRGIFSVFLVGSGLAAQANAVPDDEIPAIAGPARDIAILKLQDDMLLRVGERLVVGGRALCHDSGWSAGMTVQRLAQYGPTLRPEARKVLGVESRPTITGVAGGSAADRAGLRPGDVIAAADGTAFTDRPVPDSEWSFDQTSEALDVLDRTYDDGEAILRVERGGKTIPVTLTPRRACRARFDVRAGRKEQATSDGLTIQISSKLLGVVESDGELAAMVAHELSHNILRHRQRGVPANRGLSGRRMETEADRLSVYLLDAAGYSPDNAVAFWRHFGPSRGLRDLFDFGHGGWRERIRIIQGEAAAIAAQRAAGQPVRAPADLAPR